MKDSQHPQLSPGLSDGENLRKGLVMNLSY